MIKRYLIWGIMLGGLSLVVMAGSQIHAQDDGESPPKYAGSSECADCHRDLSRPYRESNHAKALQEADDEDTVVLADFSAGEEVRTVVFSVNGSPRPFTLEDVAWVMGAGRYRQAFVYQNEDTYRVFPAVWNVTTQQWDAYVLGTGDWLTDPAYDWLENCAGCHTTGLDLEEREWEDDGVMCEACHGPGEAHIDAADEAGSRPTDEDIATIHAAIVVSPDPAICGRCHSQGMAADTIHPFSTTYLPGKDLLADFTLVDKEDADYWWTSNHARRNNMQFNEWRDSAHATALETMASSSQAQDACLQCHSADYGFTQTLLVSYEAGDLTGVPPEMPTLQSAQYGITCVTCHSFHVDAETPPPSALRDDAYALCVSCHTQTEVTESLHHPVQQMFEGVTVIPSVEGVPGSHFVAEDGPDCLNCHMTRLPIDGDFTLATHALKPLLPDTESTAEVQNICANCHTDLTTNDQQYLVTDLQENVRGRLTLARTRLNTLPVPAEGSDAKTLYDEVILALDFVQNDGSLGMHNYDYASQLLDFVEFSLSTLSVPGSTGQPTEGPAPTATPLPSAVTVIETPLAEASSGIRPTGVLILLIAAVMLIIGAVVLFRKGVGHA